MGTLKIAFVLCGLALCTNGAPAPAEENAGIPPLLSFKDGNVGVNFLGFKASAGLGGLLRGDGSQGGLHASAETPFGQKAHAGLGGMTDANGRSLGGLYAGATAGGGVGASAGLGGMTGAEGSVGRSYAASSAGGGRTVIKERFSSAPSAGGISVMASEEVHVQKIPKSVSTFNVEVGKDIQAPAPASQISTELLKTENDHPVGKTTYVERTIIPNYVEKTIQVPSYVEKTIRVPTYVEKTVKVPTTPTVVEKEVEVPQHVKTVSKTKQIVVGEEASGAPFVTVVKTKSKIHRRPWSHLRKRIDYTTGELPSSGGVVIARPDPALANVNYRSEYNGGPKAVSTTTIRKQYNGDLIRDIFNIPISTLGAVSNLVGNLAAGGSLAVSKSYGVAA
ncbi:homeotic protein female sterile isoform X1 [Dendroctonus ponderosae]|uniref:homeotic protein female sterile isoform X1 n=1 Tax=Dendroctonus ponderosae TaxID=77166 RepID=UPI00203660D7|nr:homeotic protein female sterile isoform X1 [Dendroctonus ponderosae]